MTPKIVALIALAGLLVSIVSAVISIASTVIAYRAKEQTRRHTEILQRAYLSVEPGGIREPYDRGDRVHGYVICRNRGHLPARKLSWHTRTDTVQQAEFRTGTVQQGGRGISHWRDERTTGRHRPWNGNDRFCRHVFHK